MPLDLFFQKQETVKVYFKGSGVRNLQVQIPRCPVTVIGKILPETLVSRQPLFDYMTV